jgi:cysteine peptidase B
MPAVFSRSASAIAFTLAVFVAIIATLAFAMPTASKLKLAAKKINNNNNQEIKIDRSLPPVINWVMQGKVGPAKSTGQCGDAEIFSTVSNIESANAIANGNFVSLSDQQLIQCMPNGCNGMAEDATEKYLKSVNGFIAANTTVITPGFCSTASQMKNPGARVIGFKSILNDITAIHAELVKGPLQVMIDASSFVSYESGIWTCPSTSQVDDTALLVGINLADPSNSYLTLQMSWGKDFGENNGFIRIRYGSNPCGITSDPSSVIVEKF